MEYGNGMLLMLNDYKTESINYEFHDQQVAGSILLLKVGMSFSMALCKGKLLGVCKTECSSVTRPFLAAVHGLGGNVAGKKDRIIFAS
ncbi:MAG: hypothetical protein ABIU77_10115 [Ferruginibacter sp.]